MKPQKQNTENPGTANQPALGRTAPRPGAREPPSPPRLAAGRLVPAALAQQPPRRRELGGRAAVPEGFAVHGPPAALSHGPWEEPQEGTAASALAGGGRSRWHSHGPDRPEPRGGGRALPAWTGTDPAPEPPGLDCSPARTSHAARHSPAARPAAPSAPSAHSPSCPAQCSRRRTPPCPGPAGQCPRNTPGPPQTSSRSWRGSCGEAEAVCAGPGPAGVRAQGSRGAGRACPPPCPAPPTASAPCGSSLPGHRAPGGATRAGLGSPQSLAGHRARTKSQQRPRGPGHPKMPASQ